MRLKATLTAACCGLLLSTNAFAWVNTTGGSGPQAIGDSAPAQAQQQYAKGGSGYGYGGPATAYGGNSNVVVNGASGPAGYGAYRGPQFPAASAYAPSYATANPCVGGGVSGGGQGLIGVTLGVQRMDKFCQADRLGNMNTAGQRIDFAWQCLDRGAEFRQAAANAGYPCPTDKPKSHVVAAAAVKPTVPVRNYWPDYCYTASAGYVKQHEECWGVPHE